MASNQGLHTGKVIGSERLIELYVLLLAAAALYEQVPDILLNLGVKHTLAVMIAIVGAVAAKVALETFTNHVFSLSAFHHVEGRLEALSQSYQFRLLVFRALAVLQQVRQHTGPFHHIFWDIHISIVSEAAVCHRTTLVRAYCPPFRDFFKINHNLIVFK
jgi:hypothetical protein